MLLLKTNLKHLRLPTMNAEFAALAREAAAANENYEQYLLRLTEVEVAARAANVLKARIKQAARPSSCQGGDDCRRTFSHRRSPSIPTGRCRRHRCSLRHCCRGCGNHR